MRAYLLSAFVILSLGLGGCASGGLSSVHYYVLNQPGAEAQQAQSVQVIVPGAQAGPRVGILPVAVPAYLNRPQIVLRQGEGVDMQLEEYNRWGEDVAKGVARVLGASISQNLRDIRGMAIPLRTGAPVDLRLLVEIRRFEGAPGYETTLEALWSVQKQNNVLAEGIFLEKRPSGPDIASLVQSQSALLDAFGAEIARAVRLLDQAQPLQKP